MLDEHDARALQAERCDRPWADERRFRSLLMLASEFMIAWGADGRLLYASPATVRFANGDDGDEDRMTLLSTAVEIAPEPEDLERVQRAVKSLVGRPGASARFIAHYRRYDGAIRALDVTVVNRLHDPSLNAFVSFSRDVTQEEQHKAALRESHELVRVTTRSAVDLVAVIDADFRLLRPTPNPTLGYPEGSLVGRDTSDLVHPDDIDGMRAALSMAFRRGPDELTPAEARLRHADGRWRDFDMVLTNCLDNPSVRGIVVNGRDVTDRKAYERQLEQAALYDPLTGLPNRALLSDRLANALRRRSRGRRSTGVVFLDIDHLAILNAGRGFDAGDRLLHAFATRLCDLVPPEDTVARFGGDEFVVLREQLTDLAELEGLADRLVDGLRAPFDLGLDGQPSVTVSAGIVVAGQGRRSESVLRDAHVAMQAAKQRGRNRRENFNADLRARGVRRHDTEAQLRRAIGNGELRVWYQPMVSLQGGVPVGAEALVRWQHPTRGLLGPDEFIPVAEETGLIVPLGELLLHEACGQAVRWQQSLGDPSFGVSVNVSARQLGLPNVVEVVAGAIAASGIAADSLTLELTETALFADSDEQVTTLQDLRTLGVELALDDFGTGFSSLSHIKRLPIEQIKIDRSFIHDLDREPNNHAIVSATLGIAKALDLQVVAEGVETEAQRSALLRLGCHFAQGFLFALPMPAELLTEQLHSLRRPDRRFGRTVLRTRRRPVAGDRAS